MENKNKEAVWKEQERMAEVPNMENNKQLVKYDVNEAAIAKMADIYMNFTIDDLDDKKQFEMVHSARMVMVGHRVAIEKRRKELKADALDWGRKVDGRAKELVGLLFTIEAHLIAEEKPVIEKEKRIKAEKEEALRLQTQDRVDALLKVGYVCGFDRVAAYTLVDFNILLETETGRYQVDQDRLAQEAADRKAEDERLEKVKAALEDEAERQRIAKQKIDLAQQKIDNDKAGFEAAKKDERDRVKAARVKAAGDKVAKFLADEKAEADAKRKEQEAIDKKLAAEKEEERLQALRPDVEKLGKFGNELLEIRGPELKDPDMKAYLESALDDIYQIADNMIDDFDL